MHYQVETRSNNHQHVETDLLNEQYQEEMEEGHYVDRHHQYEMQMQRQYEENVDLPEPESREDSVDPHETSHHLAELNELRESDLDEVGTISQAD